MSNIIDGKIITKPSNKSDGFKEFEKIYGLNPDKTLSIEQPLYSFYYIDKDKKIWSKIGELNNNAIRINFINGSTDFCEKLKEIKKNDYIIIFDTFYYEDGILKLRNDLLRYNTYNESQRYYREKKLKRILCQEKH